MSTGTAYALAPPLPILSHWHASSLLVGDYGYVAVDADRIKTQIKSENYFITLATTLEVLSQDPVIRKNNKADDLDRIANELLYLQNYYDIIEKADI